MNTEQGMSNVELLRQCCSRGSFSLRYSLFDIRYSLVLAVLPIVTTCDLVRAESLEPSSRRSNALANAFAQIIENAIPREYEKRKDWGRTKNITVGLRNEGWKLHRRKKPVKHGVWKHYRIKLVEPEENLSVEIRDLRLSGSGGLSFKLALGAKFDLWARAKVYQYGVHMIALEAVGDATVDLEIDCELAVRLHTTDGQPGVALDPKVNDSQLDIVAFQLRRVSNAKGPIIRELGEELPRLLEKELRGPKLVAKLNRAIDKKRDRLELVWHEVF